MDSVFFKIPQEKRDSIINSAFEEFSKRGFSKASTNAIVENAGISKGLLFHYFGSKKQLYESLKSFALEYIVKVLKDNIDFSQRDYFKRAHDAMMIKFSIIETYPYIYEFLKSAFSNVPMNQMKELFTPEIQNFTKNAITYNIDFSLFRSDIELMNILSIIEFTMQGIVEKFWHSGSEHFDHEKVSIECDKYLNDLKTAFYK